ncbi:hypothetical protein D0T50_07490 [Bacteroides sp. 214]|uniref:hypothetical protein n=1 Tax=Bacteroides sp. 214 TaxID=2302935 RepID=UPI0013D69029|nr:hypothetical protein [Bacteroides sp. 214]NDW12731.1 hypothetical protein [Bacteroides sp. 214]
MEQQQPKTTVETEQSKTTTEKQKIDWPYLMRYPVITVCIILGLFLLKVLIGFDISQISQITKEGIVFRDKQSAATAQLTQQLSAEIKSIKQELANLTSSATASQSGTTGKKTPIQSNGFGTVVIDQQQTNALGNKTTPEPPIIVQQNPDRAATEIGSESEAQLSYINSKKETFLKNKEGSIWLGYYTEANGWKDATLDIPAGRVTISNGKMTVTGESFKTNKNITMRESKPSKEGEGKSIGIIPADIPVTLDKVETVNGEYWGFIRVKQ